MSGSQWKREYWVCSVMNMMNVTANMILIFILYLPMLIQYSLALIPSPENGTYDSLMYIENDVQCLAQMPVGELMKIQKAIRMMHAVSAYDAHRQPNLSALEVNNQSQNQNDSRLRELSEPVAETRTVFGLFDRFKTSTTKSPLAEAFMMTGQVHDALRGGQLT